MNLTQTVVAEKFENGALEFAGVPVKGLTKVKGIEEGEEDQYIGEAFVLVPHAGSELKVFPGQFLVTFPNGHKEVHTEESLQENFDYTTDTPAAEDTQPESVKHIITKEDLENNPELSDFVKEGEEITYPVSYTNADVNEILNSLNKGVE